MPRQLELPVRIAADIERELFDRLVAKAKEEHRSVAAQIRVAIEQHLDRGRYADSRH